MTRLGFRHLVDELEVTPVARRRRLPQGQMSSRADAGLTLQMLMPTTEVPVGDVWPIVHAERAALIDQLENLDAARWEEQSLCAGWTVHDVAAHLVDTARTTRLRFVVGLARARFDFHRQNAAACSAIEVPHPRRR